MSHPGTTAAPPASAEPDARPHVPSGMILAIACVANFMVIIDTSIVNVALPAMKAALGLSAADQQWVVDAYLITFGGFLLLAARAGDLFGRKGVFQAGLLVFTAASLAGGLAQEPWLLIAARILQGIGAAALASSSLSLITASHPEGPARTHALSLWAAVGSSAGAVGVVLGGLLTTELSWRYVLFINVPIGVALLIAAAASLVPSPPRRDWAHLDLPGALTVTVGVSSLVYAVSQATTKGWGSTPVIAALTAAAVLLAAFGMIEARSAAPLVPLSILAFDGDDPELAARAIDPIRRLGTVIDDDIALQPYADTLADGTPPPPGLQFAILSAFTDKESVPEVLQILAEVRASERSPFIAVRSVGGAVSRVADDATAYAHRHAELMFVTTSAGPKPVVEAARPALEGIWEKLTPHVNGAYANFLSAATEEDVAAVYPTEVYNRLAAVKRQYDPGNLFARNHNVRPY